MPTDEQMREAAKKLGLGATGNYPAGKLNDNDQGGLTGAITVEGDRIILNFGKSVTWVAMTKQEAIVLGNLLIERATT